MTALDKQVRFWDIIRKVSMYVGLILFAFNGCILDSTGFFFVMAIIGECIGLLLIGLSMYSEYYLKKIDPYNWED